MLHASIHLNRFNRMQAKDCTLYHGGLKGAEGGKVYSVALRLQLYYFPYDVQQMAAPFLRRNEQLHYSDRKSVV